MTTNNLNKFLTIDDLRDAAKKRIPKLAFDYLDGGAGSEANIRRNRTGFEDITLCPEYLRDVTERSQKITLFGHTYDAPIGVSPVGLANLIWPKVDTYLATMAKNRNVPYILSAVGTTSLETIAEIAPEHAWFQLYVPGQDHICFDLIARAKAAGFKVLVLTVDIPEPSKRLRDLRNGFTLPFKMTPSVIWDIAKKPNWAFSTLANGTPRFENMVPYMKDAADGKTLGAAQVLQVSARVDEELVKRIRDAWDGTLVIKGILSPKSTEAVKRVGADGIIVSNHGGRQLDSAPSSIEALPRVVEAAGPDMPVMLDSGVRGGGDIVKAFASGAAFTFSGRSFVFGVGALGEAGGEHVLDIMTDEVDRTLAQIGCGDIRELGPEYLW
ncbi:MAG: alpha-hydroxy-acid oxidizing protein [Rhodospirillaceae bacterium]|jgi:(S)-mandelate dehydrogenase|nr:alpha-hydroxy-acid oxidizing protein [Rhodospirillaceae bacterium]MBT5939101.1 alpha-hydroxy-acid oxidizing protein [Rhodospirillaceae bacterium]MBT7269098.1 alpha-hydroxy-acid oxidizing protein [Rhodospirillaceae bacterium]